MKEAVDLYLKKNGVKNVDELSDEQIEDFYSKEYKGCPPEWAYLTAKSAIESGGLTKERVMHSMRKSLEIGRLMECGYIINESTNGYTPKKTGWAIEP